MTRTPTPKSPKPAARTPDKPKTPASMALEAAAKPVEAVGHTIERALRMGSVDRIITLREGQIDEIGTPAELARTGGIYAELLALQASSTKAARKLLQRYEILG